MKKNLFGTDGIRGTIGVEPFTSESLIRLGNIIALWAQETYGATPQILLGHDTRESCALVKAALETGLLMHPVTLYDVQIMPTPTISKLTQHAKQFDCGIIISASHNPYRDNGIKIIDAHSNKLTIAAELRLSQMYYDHIPSVASYDTLGSVIMWDKAEQDYIDTLAPHFQPNFLKGITVVLDCAHGATYRIAPRIFELYGATVIAINNQPNGKNINQQCGALYPASLQQAVCAHNAYAGFAFDGDGDRVIAVNSEGIIKNGDDILAILMDNPLYHHELGMVGTIMTNQGFEVFLQQHNKVLLRTPVGDKYVTECLEKQGMLIGGEQSGHIVLRDYLSTSDGIFAALRILETMLLANNSTMKSFEKYPQIFINIPILVKKDLTSPNLASIINSYKAQLPHGRFEIRYSGTEPLLRIMIEDAQEATAQALGAALAQELKKELSSAL